MSIIVKTSKSYERISETYHFKVFPDFEQTLPDIYGNLIVFYNDATPIGYANNVPLKSYYLAMCRNDENINRIYKIIIEYDKEIVKEIKTIEHKTKSLF